MAEEKQEYNFESSLQNLEKLVELLEKGELSLEDSLKSFEEGIRLTRECQKRLSEAEQKVSILVSDNSSADIQPFELDRDEAQE